MWIRSTTIGSSRLMEDGIGDLYREMQDQASTPVPLAFSKGSLNPGVLGKDITYMKFTDVGGRTLSIPFISHFLSSISFEFPKSSFPIIRLIIVRV